MQLTIQLYHDYVWQDIAQLEILQPELGTRGPVTLTYLQPHALGWMFCDDEHACSLTLPVELMTYRHQRLAKRGVPERIHNMPAVGLIYLDDRLQEWGLL